MAEVPCGNVKKKVPVVAKMMALALAMVMVLAMSAAVFAGEEPAAGGDTPAAASYSITVTNDSDTMSIVGKTYTAYKLFDVKYSGDNYSYTISTSNPFYTSAMSVLETYFDFTDIASDPNTKTVTVKESKKLSDDGKTLSASDVRALANALQPYVTGTGAGSATATAESVTIDLTEAGYYIVTGSVKPTDPENSTKEVVSAVILDNAAPTATVKPKASVPPLDKKITGEHILDEAGKAATAEVGKTVSFQLDSVVPDLTGYSKYTFIIGDTMTSGLTFTDPDGDATNDVKVYVNDADKTSDANIVISGQTLTITIPFAKLQSYTAGQAIKVTYSAVVNENALTTDFEKNTAKLTYSHSPYDDNNNETPEKEVYIFDVNIDVDKVAGSSGGAKLDGAEFVLFKGDTKPADTAEAWYKYDETNKKVTWVAKANADVFKTLATGKLDKQFKGLEAEKTGTKYGLLETKAPIGYNLLDEPIIVTITGAYDDTNKKGTITADGATVINGTVTVSGEQSQAQPVATSTVINNSGSVLPSTGGIGTTIFYVIGAILVLGAGILLVTRRRMTVK